MRSAALLTTVTCAFLASPACGKAESPSDGVARAETGQAGAKPEAPMKSNPARGPEHSVFNLVDNRLLAHVQRAGGVIALPGSAGFAKYLHFGKPKKGWKHNQKVDGRAAGIPDAYAHVDVPLSADQAQATTQLWIRLKGTARTRLEVKLNEKTVGGLDLTDGWQTLPFTLPAGAAKAGENRIQIISGRNGVQAVEWIQLGGAAAGDDPPSSYDKAAKALVLPRGGGLAWYIQVPEKGLVVGDVNAGCKLDVKVTPASGAPVTGTLEGAGAGVELGAAGGKIARLELANTSCDRATLASAALAVPGQAPTVRKDKRPKYIVFWIMDSLRADRVKPFWPSARPDVPNFEELARVGAVFRNTYVQGNESRASHASLWSGVYPVNHQMIRDGRKLDPKWVTIGEAMKSAGFYTSGVSANGYIIGRWGFGDGWDAYRNHIHDGGGVRGEDVWKFGALSLEKRTDKPFFLYLGSIDTHVSWRAKEPWISKYSPGYAGRFKKEASGLDVEKIAKGTLKITDADKRHIIAIYDSNVSYQDDLIGKLRTQLEAWGIAGDTMLVITADHGDEQWESGRVGHGGSLAESLIRVPLIIYYPPLFPAGTILEGADTIDILPTLLDAMGMQAPVEAQGESLIPLAQGVGRGYPRPSFASQYEDWHAMRLANWKIKAGGTSVKLYDVETDPYEQKDLASERPIERRFVTDAMSTFLVHQLQWKKSRWGVASNHLPQLAADLEN